MKSTHTLTNIDETLNALYRTIGELHSQVLSLQAVKAFTQTVEAPEIPQFHPPPPDSPPPTPRKSLPPTDNLGLRLLAWAENHGGILRLSLFRQELDVQMPSSTLSTACRRLIQKGLLKRQARGVYKLTSAKKQEPPSVPQRKPFTFLTEVPKERQARFLRWAKQHHKPFHGAEIRAKIPGDLPPHYFEAGLYHDLREMVDRGQLRKVGAGEYAYVKG